MCARARGEYFLLSFAHTYFATRKFPVYSVVATRDAGIIVIREKHVTRLKTKRSTA